MSHVWVLVVFNRDDEYCGYDSEVIAVYSEESFKEAMNHFEKLCNFRIEEGYVIDRWEDKKGYHFSSESEECEDYKYSYVGLKKMEVK